jgi:hypothetical protein
LKGKKLPRCFKLLEAHRSPELYTACMKRSSIAPLTIAALATLSAFAGHEVATKNPTPTESLPAGTITAGGKFGEHLQSAWVDALVPFAKTGDITLFTDVRGTWDDNGQFLFSTGLGARYLVPGHDIIIGGNVYYDFLDSQYNNHFDQLGLGAELLTKWFDARFNYYLPDNGVYPVAAAAGFRRFESGLEGWNTEAGFLIPGLDKYVEARVFGGYYQYHSRIGIGYAGWKARAEIRWTPAITTDIEWWEHDSSTTGNLNGGNWVAGGRVSLPFEIGNLVQGRNPFAGAGDALKFGKKREFKERLGETVWRSHRVQTVVTNPIANPTIPVVTPQATPTPTPTPTPKPTPTPTATPIIRDER